jgi:dipeptidyl aminopeptidase/acylaminoacyl peptidase
MLITFALAITLASFAAGEDEGTIHVATAGRVIAFNTDGTKQGEVKNERGDERLSPDGKRAAFAKDRAIYVANKEGGDARRLSPEGLRAASPFWSPKGDEIAFTAWVKEARQLYVIRPDGKGLRQVTDWPSSIEMPKYTPDGKLSYLRLKEEQGKFQAADLVLGEGRELKTLVKDTFIGDYAWSPDGKTLAYGTLHAIRFLDIATEKAQEIRCDQISELLDHNGPLAIAWNPAGTAIVCRLPAFVSSAATIGGELPPQHFGDCEIFIIPREGKARWFVVGNIRGELEWVK